MLLNKYLKKLGEILKELGMKHHQSANNSQLRFLLFIRARCSNELSNISIQGNL